MIVRWDEVEAGQDIGLAAGAIDVGLHRVEIARGRRRRTSAGRRRKSSSSCPVARDELRSGDCVGSMRRGLRSGDVARGKDGRRSLALCSRPPAPTPPFRSGAPEAPRIVNLASIEPDYEGEIGKWVVVARKAGAVRGGLNWATSSPGRRGGATSPLGG